MRNPKAIVGVAVLVLGTAAVVSPAAMAQESNPVFTGGNGARHFFTIDGYVDSNSGCEYYGDNALIRPGRDHTFTVIGHMWLENGTLQTDAPAAGVLHRDGSFHLDYPLVGPSELRAIDGQIGASNPGGLDAPITGTWTAPYPNGTSTCLTHWVITKGHVNLTHGGFGVPLGTRAKTGGSDHGGGLPFAPMGAGVVALFGLGGLLIWKKPWQPRCRCACTAEIVGQRELYMGDPATRWTLEASGGGVDALDTWLVGTVPDGDTRPPKKLRKQYTVKPSEKCVGGGRVSTWGARWTLGETAADHVVLDVVVTAGINCADGTTATITCTDRLTIALHPHCGPDITDQYIAALNRVISRIRARNRRMAELGLPTEDVSFVKGMETTLTALGEKIGLVDWDEAELGPLHLAEWLVTNGPWINFRPYSQKYKRVGGEPPFWEPGNCPSCLGCGATITFFGVCIDNYVIDAMMYGVACGLLGVNRQSMVSGGLFAKWLGDHHLVKETHTGAIPAWLIGHQMGEHARDDPSYEVGALDPYLIMLANRAPRRVECRTCSKKVEINGVDWASLDWSSKNLAPLRGKGEKAQYPSPPPSTTTPFPTTKTWIEVPGKKKP